MIFRSTANDTVNFVIDASVSGLSEGFHALFVRFQDDNNNWSLYEGRTFYIQPEIETQPPATLVAMEYFIGTDPGVDNGIAIDIAESDTIDQVFDINLTDIVEGSYSFFIRFKDEIGRAHV